jgi:hypothetical protein
LFAIISKFDGQNSRDSVQSCFLLVRTAGTIVSTAGTVFIATVLADNSWNDSRGVMGVKGVRCFCLLHRTIYPAHIELNEHYFLGFSMML